jgi:hypothetical protein
VTAGYTTNFLQQPVDINWQDRERPKIRKSYFNSTPEIFLLIFWTEESVAFFRMGSLREIFGA